MVDLFWVVICYVGSVIFLKAVVTEAGTFKMKVCLTLPPRLLNFLTFPQCTFGLFKIQTQESFYEAENNFTS